MKEKLFYWFFLVSIFTPLQSVFAECVNAKGDPKPYIGPRVPLCERELKIWMNNLFMRAFSRPASPDEYKRLVDKITPVENGIGADLTLKDFVALVVEHPLYYVKMMNTSFKFIGGERGRDATGRQTADWSFFRPLADNTDYLKYFTPSEVEEDGIFRSRLYIPESLSDSRPLATAINSLVTPLDVLFRPLGNQSNTDLGFGHAIAVSRGVESPLTRRNLENAVRSLIVKYGLLNQPRLTVDLGSVTKSYDLSGNLPFDGAKTDSFVREYADLLQRKGPFYRRLNSLIPTIAVNRPALGLPLRSERPVDTDRLRLKLQGDFGWWSDEVVKLDIRNYIGGPLIESQCLYFSQFGPNGEMPILSIRTPVKTASFVVGHRQALCDLGVQQLQFACTNVLNESKISQPFSLHCNGLPFLGMEGL